MIVKTRNPIPPTLVTRCAVRLLHAPRELNDDSTRVGLVEKSGPGACATLFFASVRRAAASSSV